MIQISSLSPVSHTHEIAHFSPRYACLRKGAAKAYTHVADQIVHCTAGRLWITLEGDATDYVLNSGERLVVPNQGKVLISGPGCYRISAGLDGMDLGAAS